MERADMQEATATTATATKTTTTATTAAERRDDDETTTKERTSPAPTREPTARTPGQHGSGGVSQTSLVCTRRPGLGPPDGGRGGGNERGRTKRRSAQRRQRAGSERPPRPRPPHPGRPPATSGRQPRGNALGRGRRGTFQRCPKSYGIGDPARPRPRLAWCRRSIPRCCTRAFCRI